MFHWARRILQFSAVFTGVVAVAVLLVIWRVSSQPITSTTLTPYVEAAVGSLLPNTKAKIEDSLIEWDNLAYALSVTGNRVRLADRQDKTIGEIPSVKIRINIFRILQGQFIPGKITVDSPHLWFVRHTDGSVWFGGERAGSGEAASSESLSMMEVLHNISAQIMRPAKIRDLAVNNATFSIFDQQTQKEWEVRVPALSFHHGWRNVNGKAQIEVDQKDHTSLMEAGYSFNRLKEQHELTFKFSGINPSLLSSFHSTLDILSVVNVPLGGEIEAATDAELNVVALGARIQAGKGYLLHPDFWDQPRRLDDAKIEVRYDRKTGRLDVPLADIDFGGPKLSMKMKAGKPSERDKVSPGVYDMAFTLDIGLSDLPMDSFAAVWPKPIITNARAWIADNLSKGVFKQGNVTLRGQFNWNDPENMLLESGEGKVSAANGTVKYMDGMPPVEGVNAEAPFDLQHMDVHLSGGGIGAIRLQPSTLRLTGFDKTTQYIDIPVRISAPARDVIALIDQPPLGYAKAAGLKAEDCEGKVDGTLNLRLPLLKALLLQDVGIGAKAQLTGFGVRNVMKGVNLSQGKLDLNLDKDGYSLKGPAALNSVPLSLEWQNLFSEEKAGQGKPYRAATLSGAVTDEQWKQLGLDLSGKAKGMTYATLRYMEPNKKDAQLSGEIDFREAAVKIGDLAWDKPTGVPAKLVFDASMQENKDVWLKSFDLQGEGISAKGTGTLDRKTFDILNIQVKPFVLGRTNATLKFSQTFGENGELRFSAEGESFDVSGLTGGKDPAREDPRVKDYVLNLGKLYTSADGFISGVQAHARRDPKGWSAIELHGKADGVHPLDISLASQGAKLVFSLTCDNFGKALKGMGFTDTVNKGAIEVKGESVPENPRAINGTVKIGRFVVTGLPVLASLLNAASPFGFVDLVTGQTTFDNLDGTFKWEGDSVELMKVRAAGSVFGINIDGRVDLNTGQSDLNGLLVPFSMFNRIIGSIPLLGDVITGGEGGGVLAVSYTLKGTLNDPDISVNPVSLLTPGFLRNLFFGVNNGSGDKKE